MSLLDSRHSGRKVDTRNRLLDSPDQLSRLDPQGLFQLAGEFDLQLERSLTTARNLELKSERPLRSIVLCGMGGSAIAGDFLKACLYSELPVPLEICRDYTVPGYVGAETLVLVCSYSGNTEETLSAFEECRQRGAYIVCFTSGGELEGRAREYKLLQVPIPAGLPPRTAFGYSLVPMLGILSRLGLIRDALADVEQSLGWVRQRIGVLGPAVPVAENSAKRLALSLRGHIPVVYASQGRLEVIARRWVCQFAENGKHLGFMNLLPEMNHNEIVGWMHPAEDLSKFIPIFLRDREDHPRIQIRAELTCDLLRKKAGHALEFWTDGKTWLERLWTLLLLGDFASLYLACLNREDPGPVTAIEGLKKRLQEYS